MAEFIHPELSPDEAFFINSDMRSFKTIRFKSKRMGVLTYDGQGKIKRQPDQFPVFVKKEELMRKDVRAMRLRFRELQFR